MNGTLKNNGESQIQVAIGLILEVLADKNPLVAETAASSLNKLAEVHPNHVLNSSKKFCKKTSSLNEHISQILNIMENICTQYIIQIDGDTILSTTDFCLEMITKNNYSDNIQEPACNVLVSIGRKHHIQVLDKLMVKLEGYSLPHFMIVYTLGSLASVNAAGVVPFLKDIFKLTIPLLGGLKQEIYKQSFAFAYGSFCDALIEYVANINQVPGNTISWENFQPELATIYEILATTWILSKDVKTVEKVLIAVTSIFPLLDIDKITEHTVKQIQTLLFLYKKPVDPYFITKCLEAVIKKTTTVDGTLIEPLLNNIMQNMSDLLSTSPDYVKPETLKAHSEVLRCYECLALHFTDNVIDQLVGQLKNNNDKEKVKGLSIITHLTSYSNNKLIERRLKDIMKHFNDVLYESDIQVKKALLKIIIAFASKGILFNKDINPDGAERYMEFILKLCCSHAVAKNNDIDLQEIEDLQKSADNTLCMLSTSVPELEETLWKLLMKSFLSPNYDDAIVVNLRCLTHLAARKEIAPNCESAFIRCMILLAIPLPGFRGTFILNFLKRIRPCDLKNYENVWDMKIPQLMKYLEQNYDNFNDNEWQDLVFDFLNVLLDTIKDEKSFQNLLKTARDQLFLYNLGLMGGSEQSVKNIEKHFLLKCIALLLCHIRDKDLVLQTLDNIMGNVKLTDYSELHACAEAVGIISKRHLEIVLDKLSIIRKDLSNKKMKLFQIPFIKDKNLDIGRERLRYTIICSYAEVCNEAPPDKLLKIIESQILDFVEQELKTCKDFQIRKACLKTIGSVADAMHPNRNTLHIHLKSRQNILKVVSSEIHLHNGSEFIELFPVILPVITSLIRLPATLESDERIRLLKLCFDSVYNASSIYCKINEEDQDHYYGTLKLVPYITSSFTKLNQLVQELLLLNLSPETLDEIVTLLETWLTKRKVEQRLPACETLRIALQTFLDNMKFAYDVPNNFTQIGLLLSRIVPRCTDPNNNIRRVAVENLCLVLCIASRYEGHMRDRDKILSNSMQYIQQQIEQHDPKLIYNLTTDLSNIICNNIPQFQLIHFVEGLIDGLVDCESSSSNGSGIVLNLTLKSKGIDLQSHIVSIVLKILNQIKNIKCTPTRTSALRAIQSIASHHSKIVSGILLQQPIPFEQSICDCWMMISTDETLVQNILDQFKKIMKNTPLYEEHGSKSDMKIASLVPLQVICALHEIFKNNQLKDTCLQQFPELFSILLITLSSYIGTAPPVLNSIGDKKEKYTINREAYKLNPTKIALETFQLFLMCCDYKKMSNNILSFSQTDNEKYPWFLDIISMLVENICQDNPQYISWLVASLGPFIRAELEPQRVAVVAFFTFLLRQKANDQAVLAENLLEMILDVQMDQSCFIKQIGLQGLGYAIEYLKPELISRHCKPILSVLMSSLDYNNIGNEGAVILEGLSSFSKLLTTLEGHKFSSCQVTAAVRIKPLFGQEDVQLRRASFRLLGDLTKSINSDSNLEAFKEQIHGNLITLLLHLCDPDQYVVKACKYTLRQIGPHLEGVKTNTMIQEHLIDEANLQYHNFIKDLIKVMSEELQEYFPLLIMTSLSYFKSPWMEIRGNAGLVAGLLYSTLNDENKNKVSIDTVSYRLMNLMSDEHEQVRMKSVQATVYLFIK